MGLIKKVLWGTILTGFMTSASSCIYNTLNSENSPEIKEYPANLAGLGGLIVAEVGLIGIGASEDLAQRKYNYYQRERDNPL